MPVFNQRFRAPPPTTPTYAPGMEEFARTGYDPFDEGQRVARQTGNFGSQGTPWQVQGANGMVSEAPGAAYLPMSQMPTQPTVSPPQVPTQGGWHPTGALQEALFNLTQNNPNYQAQHWGVAPGTPSPGTPQPQQGGGSPSMGRGLRPFGQTAFGTGFGGRSSAYAGFGNPAGRARYDRRR